MRGRNPKPLDPDAPPAAAALGRALRAARLTAGLTQTALAERAGGCSAPYISALELAKTYAARPCIGALDAGGALLELLPAAVHERTAAAQARAVARAGATLADVDPTNRRGLLEAAAGSALGVPVLGGAPVAARDVDPGLVDHWTNLLALLGRLDAMFGARDVLDTVRSELRVIAAHRDAARGELRIALMRVEARWAEFGAWLAHDCGDVRGRDALLDQALRLARESGYADLIAWARARQAQWTDAPSALRLAERGLRTPHANAQTRAWCAARVAHSHARLGDAESAQHALDDVAVLVEQESRPPPRMVARPIEQRHLRAWEARCWASLAPRRAISLYEALLRDWPRELPRDGALHRARMAIACARAGELDRAKVEAARALTVVRSTNSAATKRELRQLGAMLNAA